MAQKVKVLLVDDVDNTPYEGDEGETMTFGLDGTTYEIDLKAENATALRDSLSKWVRSARRVGGGGGRRGGPAPASKREVDPHAVREWAKARGIKVSDRGRISASLLEQYKAAGN